MVCSSLARTSALSNLARTAPLFGLLVFGGLGCGGEAAAPARPVVPVVTGEQPRPAAGGFEGVRFSCCADPSLAAAVQAYANLGAALAKDDAAGATAAMTALEAAIGVATASPQQATAVTAVQAARGAWTGTLATDRGAFLGLFEPMRELARAGAAPAGAAPAGAAPGASFAVAYCPMKPGRWIQDAGTPTIANPYSGAQMLTCGAFEAL